MKLRHLYLAFAVIGLVLPYSQFVPWIVEHHALNMELFIRDLFANRISAFFAMDVIVSLGEFPTTDFVSQPEGKVTEDWNIPDPMGHTIEFFEIVRDQIEMKIQELKRHLGP